MEHRSGVVRLIGALASNEQFARDFAKAGGLDALAKLLVSAVAAVADGGGGWASLCGNCLDTLAAFALHSSSNGSNARAAASASSCWPPPLIARRLSDVLGDDAKQVLGRLSTLAGTVDKDDAARLASKWARLRAQA